MQSKLSGWRVVAGVGLLLLLVALAFSWPRLKRDSQESDPPVREAIRPPASAEALSETPSQPGVPPPPATRSAEVKTREAAIQEMHEASITYDPAQLAVIQPYLRDPDPEIRQAARDAALVLGDASASPMLRDAAKGASSPEESAMFEEAAAFLDLPPGSFKKLSSGRKAGEDHPSRRTKRGAPKTNNNEGVNPIQEEP